MHGPLNVKVRFYILYSQRDATYTTLFIIISAVHTSGEPSAHHQEPITLCAALGIVMLSCCIPLVCQCSARTVL